MEAQMDTDMIALFATAGRRIAIISESQEISDEFGEVLYSARSRGNVRRHFKANGEQRVEFNSGGHVLLMQRQEMHRLRGRTLDMIVIDDHRYMQDEEFLRAIIPCFSAAPGGRPRIGVLVI